MLNFLRRLFGSVDKEVRAASVQESEQEVRTTVAVPLKEQIARKVGQLDLSSVKQELMKKKGWSQERTDRIEREYRQFLYLAMLHRNTMVVPWSRDLDDFWHQHINDTPKYRRDCTEIFGRYFDHNPHVAKTKSRAYKRAKQETLRLRQQAFTKRHMADKASIGSADLYDEVDGYDFDPLLLWMILDDVLDAIPQETMEAGNYSGDANSESSGGYEPSGSSDSESSSCGGGDSGGGGCGGGD